MTNVLAEKVEGSGVQIKNINANHFAALPLCL